MQRFLILAIVFVIAGCAPILPAPNEEAMLIKASALTKLSAAAESAVRYKKTPEDLADRALLQWATTHDPSLLAPFSTYTLRVLRQERHAVVLMCTEDGMIALIEDAGCTAASDRHRWRDTPGAPCEFTIDPRSVCGTP